MPWEQNGSWLAQRCRYARLSNLDTTLIKVNACFLCALPPYLWSKMFRQRAHIALLFLSLGLLLLGVFLWLFLQKTWISEQESLERELKVLFVSAVHDMESEVFKRIIIQEWEGLEHDSTIQLLVHESNVHTRVDSSQISLQGRQISKKHTQTVVAIQSESSNPPNIVWQENRPAPRPDSLRGLSVMIATDKKISLFADSSGAPLIQVLENKFRKAMDESALPLTWQIAPVPSTSDSIRANSHIIAGEYTDLSSDRAYQAEISGFKPYLWKKIAPQMLFSGLLFACVGLAFLFVYQSYRQQLRLTELKNEFIQNMTHELKTPISTVGVAIEALQNFDALSDPVRTREYLQISQHELNRLRLLVDKVLRMSSFEQGVQVLKKEPVDVKKMVEEVLGAMKLQFEKYRAEVHFSVSGQHFWLQGDRLHLVSVLYNLLENALKYSPLSPQITVHLAETERQLTLQVSDQGRGIPKEYQNRIFDKFFRVPTGQVHDVKGHGLGLNYVAGVLRLHQGRVEVRSMEGEGTVFTVILPVFREG